MSEEKHKDALRTIGEVADEIGVATHVLRFWESKFPQIKPQKRRGRRYYGAKDVAIIKIIKTLLYDQGYTIKGVHKFLDNAKKEHPQGSNITSLIPESESTTPDDKFKHDIMGNIVADNEPGNSANSTTTATDFDADELDKLHQIYNGLCEARKKLSGAA